MTSEELNRDYIHKIAKDNPIIYNLLVRHLYGELTYEQALIGMVAHLVIQNKELTKLSVDRISILVS